MEGEVAQEFLAALLTNAPYAVFCLAQQLDRG